MDEPRRTGSPKSASSSAKAKAGGATEERNNGQPQSCEVSRSRGTGIGGATGRRVQVGPVQGQGFAGWDDTLRVKDTSAGFVCGLRSMWIGESQPARAVAGVKKATLSNASGMLRRRAGRRTEVHTKRSILGFTNRSRGDSRRFLK